MIATTTAKGMKMKWNPHNRKFWHIGERVPFRLSKSSCQTLLFALVACDGKIHSVFSLDVREGRTTPEGMKPHECAVLLSISLPMGAENLFRELSDLTLEIPPVVHLN